MRRIVVKMSKVEIAASLAPVAMMIAVFALPAQSDAAGEPGQMTFDSVGSMLQDMDREKSVVAMERYSNLPRLEASSSEHACETEDLNRRLQEVYAGLQERIGQTSFKEVARLERKVEVRRIRDVKMALRAEEVEVVKMRRSAKAAAQRLRSAIIDLREERESAVLQDDKMLAEAVETALQAAEAALANAP